MTQTPLFRESDWGDVSLVVFDVDGTLYRQQPLRLRMARDILFHALLKRDLNVVTVLTKYRRIKERLSNEEVEDFEPVLIAETAISTSNTLDSVRAIVSEWIDQRPLSYLAGCRYPKLPQLFAGLRRDGKSIGVFSDYPIKSKLKALELTADYLVFAGDQGIGRLKPHPRTLEFLIAAAGVKANATMVIGDRVERDGLAARRAGARVLIMSAKPIKGWQTFRTFGDPVFARFLAS